MYRFAIVGCGHIAKKHVAAIQVLEEATLVAVCDTNPERLAAFTTDEVEGFTPLTEMLQTDIDVVCVCTPSGLHAGLTIEIAKAGKHVIVEKPMALTLSDANQMIEACERYGVKLAVVHPNRFRPAIEALKEQVTAEAFGKIGHVNATVRWNRDQSYYDQAPWRGTRAMDGGVLMNQAIHNMDLLLWLMGDIEQVSCYHATRMRKIESEDTSLSVIQFQNGVLGMLEAAVTIYPKNLEESIAIFGEKGTAIVGGLTANWIKKWEFSEILDGKKQIIQAVEEDPWGVPGHQRVIADMIEAIRDDREPAVSGYDGRKAVAFVLGCHYSAELNRPVYMEELDQLTKECHE